MAFQCAPEDSLEILLRVALRVSAGARILCLRRIMRVHGGLADGIVKSVGHGLTISDVKSFMWTSLAFLPESVAEKSSVYEARNIWMINTLKIIWPALRSQINCAGVYMPLSSKRLYKHGWIETRRKNDLRVLNGELEISPLKFRRNRK